MEHGPFSSMIDLFKMVIFQFALLVYHRVYANKSPHICCSFPRQPLLGQQVCGHGCSSGQYLVPPGNRWENCGNAMGFAGKSMEHLWEICGKSPQSLGKSPSEGQWKTHDELPTGWFPPVMFVGLKTHFYYSYIYHKNHRLQPLIRQLSYLGGPILYWRLWFISSLSQSTNNG